MLFLAIELPQKNGIELGQMIRSAWKMDLIYLVFISGKSNYCMDLFDVHPLNFHLKPLKHKDVVKDIDLVRERVNTGTLAFRYREDGVYKSVCLKDVVYFVGAGKGVEVHCKDGRVAFAGNSLQQLCDIYEKHGFSRCHKSYLINLNYVFQSYELWLLYRCFFGKSKRGAGIEFLAFVLFFAVTMLLNVFIDIPILTGLSSYVMLVLIAFFGYESGWKQGLLYSVFAFVSMTLAECIVGLATGFLDLNVFQSREYYNVWGMVALPVVQYLVVLMIRNFRNLQKGREIPILYWAVTIVLPVFSLYLDLMICQQNFYWLNMLGCTVILFVMNVLVFYLCDVQIENMRVRFE